MKEEAAERLAHTHYRMDPTLTLVHRVIAAPEVEADPQEPIKLLEVNEAATADGIIPVTFGPQPKAGVVYSSVIMEITAEEYAQIVESPSTLPNNWQLGEKIERTASVA